MAKPNYAFEKRQRELAKKKKKEEKRLRRTEASENESGDVEPAPTDEEKAPEDSDT